MDNLKLTDANFWTLALPGDVYFDSDFGAHHVNLPEAAEMVPILRGTNQSIMDAILDVDSKAPLKAAINGMFFGGAAVNDPIVDPTKLDIQGVVRLPEGLVLYTKSQPLMFYVRRINTSPFYQFGFGDPPTDSLFAIGGAGPLIINGLPYDCENHYDESLMSGVSASRCPSTGEPDQSDDLDDTEKVQCRAGLIARSNATFADLQCSWKSFFRFRSKMGKATMGHVPGKNRILFIVQGHDTSGKDLRDVRDIYKSLQAENAIFFDGSDSVTLFTHTERFVIEPNAGSYKNKSIPVAIGFR